MRQLYFEFRLLKTDTAPVAADIARHLQSRQYLGTAVVVCENPIAMISATRKQWLRLARNLQKQRASTLNAEEILRFTHTIMHMQHMQFVCKSPAETSDAEVYFVTPNQLTRMPRNCFSLYLTTYVSEEIISSIAGELPESSLLVNYDVGLTLSDLGIDAKYKLDARVLEEWNHLHKFLQKYNINPHNLIDGNVMQLGAMDDALDTLLSTSNEFLREAAAFQHAMNLSQPFVGVNAEQQKLFEAVTRLAHRVQALTPGAFSNYLIKTFGDKDAQTYFLRDVAPEDDEYMQEQNESMERMLTSHTHRTSHT